MTEPPNTARHHCSLAKNFSLLLSANASVLTSLIGNLAISQSHNKQAVCCLPSTTRNASLPTAWECLGQSGTAIYTVTQTNRRFVLARKAWHGKAWHGMAWQEWSWTCGCLTMLGSGQATCPPREPHWSAYDSLPISQNKSRWCKQRADWLVGLLLPIPSWPSSLDALISPDWPQVSTRVTLVIHIELVVTDRYNPVPPMRSIAELGNRGCDICFRHQAAFGAYQLVVVIIQTGVDRQRAGAQSGKPGRSDPLRFFTFRRCAGLRQVDIRTNLLAKQLCSVICLTRGDWGEMKSILFSNEQ